MDLITLEVGCKGEVLLSNLPEFREALSSALAEIPKDLTTPEEFHQAETHVKGLKAAEKAVADAKTRALDDAAPVRDLFDQLDDIADLVRTTRLELERQVKAEKARVRERMIEDALANLATTLGIPDTVAGQHFRPEIESAIKGKKTLKSLESGIATATGMIVSRAGKIDRLIEEFAAEHGVTHDRDWLIGETPDRVAAELKRRVEQLREDAARKEAAALEREKRAAEAREAAEAAPKTAPPAEESPFERGPKIGSIPVGRKLDDPADAAREWAEFRQTVVAAFRPVKEARNALRHAENVEKGAQFAAALAEAWNRTA